MKKKSVYEKINSKEELMTFLNSIGVQRQLNKRKNLVLLDRASDVTLQISKDVGSYTDHKKIVVGIPTDLLVGLSKKKVILLLEGLTIHECYHNLRTVQSVWVKFIKECGAYFAKEFNAPTLFCEIQAKELLNCVEDGRIERIASRESNYSSKCLAITNATFFNLGEEFVTRKGSPEEELDLTISNFVFYAKFGIPIFGYAKYYPDNMKYFNKAKKHIFKFVEEDSFEKAIPHLQNAIDECYELFKRLFSEIDFNKVPDKKQNEIGEGCGSQDGKPSSSQGSSSSKGDSNNSDSKDNSSKGDSSKSDNGKSDSTSKGEKCDTDEKDTSSGGSDEKSDNKSDKGGEGSTGKEKDNKDEKGDSASSGSSKGDKDSKEKGSLGDKSEKDTADKEKGKSKSKKSDSPSSSNGKSDGKGDDEGKKSDNKKSQGKVAQGNESENPTIKEIIDSINDVIMNSTEYDDSKNTAEISDILKDIEKSLEIELNDSVDTILEIIERENKEEEERIKEENNEVDDTTLVEIFNATKKVNPSWSNFKLRYIYQNNDNILEAPKEYLKSAYRMREYFKKILEPQKKSISRNKRRGQIDRGSLWKYAVNDDKMFQRRNNPHNNDYAIYIMVDGSGSMGSGKFKEAFLATMLLEEVLCDLVPLKIVMFNTNGVNIDHNIVKNFSDNKKGSYSYSFLTRNHSYGANADGLSIRFGTYELLKRKERDKMLIVLSDGQPSSSLGYNGQNAINDVRNAVDFARDNNIKVFNIMFGTTYERNELASTFKYMYQKGIVSCDPEKISEELMRIIRLEIK